jgi:DNA polymerase III gamma/tau subunit
MLLLRKAGSPEKTVDLAEDDRARLKALAGHISDEELLRCFRIFFNAESDILRSSSPRIALELCLLEMITLKQAVPLEDLVERVRELAAGTHHGAAAVSPERSVRELAAASPAVRPRPAHTDAPSGCATSPAPAGAHGQAADFIDFVRGRKYMAAVSHLERGELELDGDRLRVTVPLQSFHSEWLRSADAQARLNELASEFFGRPVRLEVAETMKKKAPEDDGAARRRAAENSALHNPLVQRVVETFQGKVVEVKTDI